MPMMQLDWQVTRPFGNHYTNGLLGGSGISMRASSTQLGLLLKHVVRPRETDFVWGGLFGRWAKQYYLCYIVLAL